LENAAETLISSLRLRRPASSRSTFVARILAQPRREHATGRAGTDDHEVVHGWQPYDAAMDKALPASEFGFPGPLRDRLVAAILTGEKISTTGLHGEYMRSGEALPWSESARRSSTQPAGPSGSSR
jgi:hypothetical protein